MSTQPAGTIELFTDLYDLFANQVSNLAGFRVQLCGYGSEIPQAAGYGWVAGTAPQIVTPPPGGGSVVMYVFPNDIITPAGTYYTISALDANGDVVQTNAYQFTGTAPVNLLGAPLYYPDGVSQPTAYRELIPVPWAANVVFPGANLSAVAYKLVLTGNTTSSSFPTTFPGQLVSILVEQDGVGGREFTPPSNVFWTVAVNTAPYNKTGQIFVTMDDGNLYPLSSANGGGAGSVATINVGSTTTGPAGSQASVANVGTPQAAVLNFTIPTGPTGPPGTNGTNGTNGAPGAAATVAIGVTTTLAPNVSASVSNSGSSSAAVLNFGIPQGIQGAPGAAGAAGSVTVGTTTTGAPGSQASVTNSGTTQAAVLNFTVPQGPAGAQGNTGNTGSAGAAATVAVGTTTTGAAGSQASVTNSGSSSAAVLNFAIPQGAQGATGAQGNPGTAATVAVGSVTTGASGSQASVTNSGSSSAAVFNFTIPQGPAGAAATLPTASAAGQFLVSSGSGTTYTARALTSSDIPNNAANTTGTAANVTGTVAIANGGTGATTASGALSALGAVPLAGGTMTGPLTLSADPASTNQAATKHYVDTQVATALPVAGGTISGNLTVQGTTTLGTTTVGNLTYADLIGASGQSITVGTISNNGSLQVNGQATVTGKATLTGTGNVMSGAGGGIAPSTGSSGSVTINGNIGTGLTIAPTAAITSSAFANLTPGALYMLAIQWGSTAYAVALPPGLANPPTLNPVANTNVYQLIYALTATTAVGVGPLSTP